MEEHRHNALTRSYLCYPSSNPCLPQLKMGKVREEEEGREFDE
jgi:hypothetical protein